MHPLQLPPLLPRDGRLGVIAPASRPDPKELELGAASLRKSGFQVELGRHVLDSYGHLAGRDEDRAADLHEMFTRPDIDAVICARGGSGSIRLLRHLDWSLLASHPKPFLGYSDITVLQLALLRKCGLPSLFAPMVASDFGQGIADPCADFLWRLACVAEPPGPVTDDRCRDSICLVAGVAEGPCIGGTLSLVAATLGTPYEPDLKGAIFFFEDVDESPAHIERYLSQMLLGGRLEGVAGFLIGNAPWSETTAPPGRYLSLEQVYIDLLAPLGRPLLYGWPHGHDPDPLTIAQGIRVRLDAGARALEFLEPAVRPR